MAAMTMSMTTKTTMTTMTMVTMTGQPMMKTTNFSHQLLIQGDNSAHFQASE